jgi:O6-methylguanine-DNA--protein-cysteine methyltransferase
MIRLSQAFVETPVATMRALSTGDALCSLEFFRKGRMARLDARLARWFKDAEIVDGETPVIARTREWLRAYFAGESADISSLTLEMRGAPFEVRVWNALKNIPAGTTTTYGAIIVPCHRVIGSNGTLTGYGGGLETKSWLLSHERRWAREPALF